MNYGGNLHKAVEMMGRERYGGCDRLRDIGKQAAGVPYDFYINCDEGFSELDMGLEFLIAEELSVKDNL